MLPKVFWCRIRQASGQKLNREKTSVFFCKATPEVRKLEVIDALGVSAGI